ncbi:MAG: ankyrin repeat domain-containing protein [Planctomycetes bacterium]|nr:ankyrin repeat domain-containing protein [Planctomycetota bacterium]
MATQKIRNLFVDAVHCGDVAEVERLLSSSPELLNVTIVDGTLMHFAAYAGKVPMLEFLLSKSLDINAGDDGCQRPLHEACSEGHMDAVRWLLDHGADINAGAGENHRTPMIGAVIDGHEDIVRLLIERGADVNATYGDPPKNALGFAIEYGHERIEKLLREHGAVKPFATPDVRESTDAIDKIAEYLGDHFGPVDKLSHHEIVPDGIPIALHTIPPGTQGPFRTLFTTGMSELAMDLPDNFEGPRHAELLMYLPPDWPTDKKSLADARFRWPFIWLQNLAREVLETEISVFGWFIISTAEPPKPVCEGTGLSCFLLMPSQPLGCVELTDGRRVSFIEVVAIHEGERDLASSEGLPELLQRFSQRDTGMVIDLDRPDVSGNGGE